MNVVPSVIMCNMSFIDQRRPCSLPRRRLASHLIFVYDDDDDQGCGRDQFTKTEIKTRGPKTKTGGLETEEGH